jgi:hypothetical protein
MRRLNRLLDVDTEVAQQNPRHYEIYTLGAKWAAVGAAAVAAGLVGDSLGIELASGVALGGAGVFGIGGTIVTFEAGLLQEQNEL